MTCLKGAAVCNAVYLNLEAATGLNRLSLAPNNLRRDRDPLVTSTGIGDCLHYSHVAQPVFKSRIGSLVIACFHGIEEIILDRPFPGEFRRHFHFMQGAIAYSTGFDHIGSEIVNQGPGRAVTSRQSQWHERGYRLNSRTPSAPLAKWQSTDSASGMITL